MGAFSFERVEVAAGFARRLRGLMGVREVEPGYAILFLRCSSVHTCFMRTAIDVVYLDDKGAVVGAQTLAPWRLGRTPAGTRAVLECRAGTVVERGLRAGDRLVRRKGGSGAR